MKDKKKSMLYIGKAKNLKSRVQSYFVQQKNLKNQFLIPKVDSIKYILTDTEEEAFLLEAHLIKKHKPRYNICLKDDKSYPYIRCSMEEQYPRFYLDRKAKKKGSLYFGPYTQAGSARKMIHLLNARFKIRDCSSHFMKNRKTPCLTYDIGRCTAPCVKTTAQKNYQEQVKQALKFLRARNQDLIQDMKIKMQKLAGQERFEEAKRLRDYIHSIEFCRGKQFVVDKTNKDTDVLAVCGDSQYILFQTLHIRSGCVVGERHYFEPKPKTFNSCSEDVFKGFIMQYYMDNFLPDRILADTDSSLFKPAEKKPLKNQNKTFTILKKALSKVHNKTVRLSPPKGQTEQKWMNMAFRQAQHHIKELKAKKNIQTQILQEIQKKLQLPNLPQRMECFDVSHFQGEFTTAGQAVFENGRPEKQSYRKYKIKSLNGIDDFAALRETLTRRLKHTEYKEPDLILVDGGKGQLTQALRVLKELNVSHIPLAAIAKARVKSDFSAQKIKKGTEKFFLPNRKNPVLFPSHSKALALLAHIRDEAHRFAITYHRKLISTKHL